MKVVFVFISCLVASILYAQEKNILKVEYEEIVTYIPQIVNYDKGLLIVSSDEVYYKTILNNVSSVDEGSIIVQSGENDYFSEILINKNKNILTENLFERYARRLKQLLEGEHILFIIPKKFLYQLVRGNLMDFLV